MLVYVVLWYDKISHERGHETMDKNEIIKNIHEDIVIVDDAFKQNNPNAITKQLNKNVDVVESTFKQNNLQVISYGFCGVRDDNGWMEFLIEIISIDGAFIKDSIKIKVNFYDENDTIIYSDDKMVLANHFDGYDTLHLYLQEDNLAFNTVKCRLFATRA